MNQWVNVEPFAEMKNAVGLKIACLAGFEHLWDILWGSGVEDRGYLFNCIGLVVKKVVCASNRENGRSGVLNSHAYGSLEDGTL